MESKKIASSDASGAAKRTDTEQPAASLHLDNAPAQNSNESHNSSKNDDTATIHITTEGCSNLAFSDTDQHDTRSEESKIWRDDSLPYIESCILIFTMPTPRVNPQLNNCPRLNKSVTSLSYIVPVL